MTHLRLLNRGCVPARPDFQTADALMNWFWSDLDEPFRQAAIPAANVVETDESYLIELSVPGYTRELVNVKLENGILTVSGEKSRQEENEGEKFLRREFRSTTFRRSFRISEKIDSASITARCENGILTLTLPKVEQAKTRPAIDIRVA